MCTHYPAAPPPVHREPSAITIESPHDEIADAPNEESVREAAALNEAFAEDEPRYSAADADHVTALKGYSHGCLTMTGSVKDRLIDRIRGGSLIYAGPTE